MTDEDAILDRARTEYREPPLYNIDRPHWSAEDPETGCGGIGDVETEALGNLVAAVVAYERDRPDVPYIRLPGQTVEKSWERESNSKGLLDRLTGRD